ncbi:AfsR/SARP family transcriptional regulator [Micromonospora sp. NBC_01796]|uniref:AfsR/SARP family transcriptional regulator n=1 Tax=Micromonospora sp. NBC_01796 TaxID=2975987 RepID=UPI002DD80A79|nr:BTAD domain-containing putative transcriptional regulator [Micromonospora sp. NBC_01796]WSA84345.1 tetratricopeptide repeat protein [Micromonospora sp. NBC_01796]
MLQVRLLGPVTAQSSDGPIPLGGSKPRALFAALVLERGRVVPASRLVDVIWPDGPPESARALIQTYVSTLRKAFARHGHPDVIGTHPPGYLARLDDATVDADILAGLVDEAREQAGLGDHGGAADLLREAIALSRGPALSGLGKSPLAAEARRLDELLLVAQGERVAAELNQGRLDHLAELTGLVNRHPTNERLRGQLMVTLYRLGRQTDALACYREGRSALVEELGVEPGPHLRELHTAILRGDGEVLHGGRSEPDPGPPLVVPVQVPLAPSDFTGREVEHVALVAALRAQTPGTHVLAGQGGSGKSALAARVAQQVRESFPDGLLYADLRGMTDSPATQDEVLAGFLRSLGVGLAHIPDSSRERTELYRSLVAGRRVLVLFDDAANERQVRPLLPAGPQCAALITSRDRLAGLAGARLTEIGVLTDDEAWALLCRIIGAERAAGDVASARGILAGCENLPLAIRIAGARLATRRHLPLGVLAVRLADERQRLDELAAGDLAVRSSITLSYRALDEQAAVALRRLGFFGIPEFDAWMLGRLLDTSEPAAERLLELLVDAHLVEFTGVDPTGALRYRLHDLVRLYARERAEADEPAEALRDAVVRAVTGWRAVIDHITTTFPPAEVVWHKPSGPRFPVPDELAKRVLGDAAGWLQREESVLAIGLERAAAIGLDELACDFVSARMALELEGANRFEFRSRIVNAALEASVLAGNLHGEADMLTELAHLRYSEDRYSESRQHFGEALSRFRALGNVRGQASALAGLGLACREPGHLAEALHFLNQSAELLRTLDDAVGLGYVHRVRGSVLLEQGNFPAALADLELSMSAYRRTGSQRGVAYTLRSLGLYHRARGDYHEALRVCAEAAEIFAELGNDLMHSYAVRAHATTQLRMGLVDEALPRLEWVLSVARDARDRWGQGVALRVLGQLHLAEGRLDLAEDLLDSAMSLWDTVQAPLWRARTEYVLSLVYRARGDLDAADRAYANAHRVFHDRNSREYVELSAAPAPASASPTLH